MPLFGRRTAETSPPEVIENRRSGMFGRRRSFSPAENTTTTTTTTSSSSPHHGFLHRHEDPSIVTARERVLGAEAAERDADRALVQARAAVREAREHIKRLEREAAEEARLAKIKQNQAKSISKRAKPLGRHDHI